MDERTLTKRVERLENAVLYGTTARDPIEAQQHFNRVMSERIIWDEEKQPEQTAFEDIINRIQGCNDRVCKTASRLEEIGTRIMGALPEQENGAGSGATIHPDGTLDHTLLALNRLDGSLARLEGATLRLERV